MARMTRLLRDVYQSHGDYGSIGLDRYPILHENHRQVLNQLIVQHYAMREIGFDTDDMFIFELRAKMNEIMPFYNELYKTTDLQYDILTTTDITGSSQGSSESSSESDTTADNNTVTNSTGRGVQSEPPASELSAEGQYATGISDSQSRSDVDQKSGSKGTASDSRSSSGVSRTVGRTAAGSALVQAYRDTIVNVDMMIVNELEELFIQILTTDEDDIPRGYFPYYAYPAYPFGV